MFECLMTAGFFGSIFSAEMVNLKLLGCLWSEAHQTNWHPFYRIHLPEDDIISVAPKVQSKSRAVDSGLWMIQSICWGWKKSNKHPQPLKLEFAPKILCRQQQEHVIGVVGVKCVPNEERASGKIYPDTPFVFSWLLRRLLFWHKRERWAQLIELIFAPMATGQS